MNRRVGVLCPVIETATRMPRIKRAAIAAAFTFAIVFATDSLLYIVGSSNRMTHVVISAVAAATIAALLVARGRER
jgi:hypothetical protein